jgi:cytochrome c-type biogenesis protein CcmH
MMSKRSFYTLFLMIFFLSIFTLGVSAQETDPATISDDEVNAIARQLYCPVCENIPLDVCGTQACIQWRQLIREKLAAGWTEAEIKEYFVLQYGDRVLAEPPRRGLNLLAYLVPPLAFLAGVFILFRGIRSWREMDKSAKEEQELPQETYLDDYITRLEDELQRVDQ